MGSSYCPSVEIQFFTSTRAPPFVTEESSSVSDGVVPSSVSRPSGTKGLFCSI